MCNQVIGKYEQIGEKYELQANTWVVKKDISDKAKQIASPEGDWSQLEQLKINIQGLTLMRWQAKAFTPLSKKMNQC